MVFERVKFERKDRDDNGNNIGKRESSGVFGDYMSNGIGSVVMSVVESRRGVFRRSEERVEGMEESRVVGREVGVRVFDEDIWGKGGVGLNVGVFVDNILGDDLKERFGELGDIVF